MITKREAIPLLPASLMATASFSEFGAAQTSNEGQRPKDLPPEIVALRDTHGVA
jgi:hypothetical protein